MTSLFSTPKAPPIPPPTPMPVPDSKVIAANKKKAAISAQTRSGRQSTILSDSSGSKFGG